MPVSMERSQAKAIYNAEWLTVGSHTNGAVADGVTGQWLAKPDTATHLRIQPLSQDIRYRLDGGQATPTTGFQIVAGTEVTLPCPNGGISIAEVAAGATIEYQWLR
jgi:hypothetical protein